MISSKIPTARSSTCCLTSPLSVSSPIVASISRWKDGQQSPNCHDNQFRSPNEDFSALHTGQWGCQTEWKLFFSKWSAVHAKITGCHCCIRPSAQSMNHRVLKSRSKGRKIFSKTFLKTSQFCSCCPFVAVVYPCHFKLCFGGTRRRATSMLARFEGFYLIVECMFPRLKYTGHSILLPD